jgi:peptidoglycan hydrolase-like protein with peptidoglycan-binding domain
VRTTARPRDADLARPMRRGAPPALVQLQMSAGNAAVGSLVARQGGRPAAALVARAPVEFVQRCVRRGEILPASMTATSSASSVLAFERAAGNAAVASVLQRRSVCSAESSWPVQRCGDRACNCGCSNEANGDKPTARSSRPPTVSVQRRGGATCDFGCSTEETEEMAPPKSNLPSFRSPQRGSGASGEKIGKASALRVQRSFLNEFAGGCGVCLGPAQAGIRAHKIITQAFGLVDPLRNLPELSFVIPPAPGDDTPAPKRARPDLIRAVLTGLQVGEVKPPLSIARGESDLRFYLKALKARFPDKNIGRLQEIIGPLLGTFPNPESPECPPQELGVGPVAGVKGLYIYMCSPTRRELRAANKDKCECKKKDEEDEKKKQPQEAPDPKQLPVPSPDAVRQIIEFLKQLPKIFPKGSPVPPGAEPAPAGPGPIIPPCPFNSPDFPPHIRCFNCPKCSDPTISQVCVPKNDVLAAVGATPAQSPSGPPSPPASSGEALTAGEEPVLVATTPADGEQETSAGSSDLVGLTRGDGLVFGTFDRRPRVAELQQQLVRQGGPLTADGMFGAQTANVLHQFQSRMGFEEADTVDEATSQALETTEPTDPSQISQLEGLTRGDGLVFGTFDRRTRVANLQSKLTTAGFDCASDGMFGPATADALHGFQVSRALEVSDTVDRQTADALEGRGDQATNEGGPCGPGMVLVSVGPNATGQT